MVGKKRHTDFRSQVIGRCKISEAHVGYKEIRLAKM